MLVISLGLILLVYRFMAFNDDGQLIEQKRNLKFKFSVGFVSCDHSTTTEYTI